MNNWIKINIALILLSILSIKGQTTNENKFIYLLSPRGTETYTNSSEIIIEWESQNIETVNIDFLNKSGNVEFSISNLPAKKDKYILDNTSKIPKQFRIKISDASYPSTYDISSLFLEIKTTQDELNQLMYNKTLTTNHYVKIMPLGNSITEGYQIPVPIDKDGYRKPLKEKLENSGLTTDFVGSLTDGSFVDNQHEGHGGWHVKHWANNKKYSLIDSIGKFLTMNPPEIILLHIGTNDIGEYEYPNRNNDNDIDTTVLNTSQLLDSIYTIVPNVKVIVAKIINRDDDINTGTVNESDTTSAFNLKLETMINSRIALGDNLRLVDMESALDYSSDLSDGVHPNLSGYSKMSEVWFDAIKSILPKLNAKIFLEGAYTANVPPMSSNMSKPNSQPFNQPPWNYTGTEFCSSFPPDVIDWVLVSLRTDTTKNSEVAKRAGFLKNDGTIVDLDGTSQLTFVVDEGSYYVVIEHRNHLPVMSSIKVLLTP